MQLSALLSGIPLLSVSSSTDCEITSVECDSRRCGPGALFVAVASPEADGHDYIADAIRRGAKAVVCERLPEAAGSVTIIHAVDSRKVLAAMCHRLHDYPARGMTVIGVTGTNGKTTTTFLLKSLLEARGERVGLIGTTGNYIGEEVLPANYTTPEAPELAALLARMRDAGIRTVVMEVSSHGLVLDRVYGMEFSGAIFTNLTQDHLDFHATMENYALAKKKLFDMLAPGAIAVSNGDDPYGAWMLQSSPAATKLLFGRKTENGIVIANEEYGLTSSAFELYRSGCEPLRLAVPLVGRFNVENVTACIGLCLAMGIAEEELAEAVARIRPARGRMERIALPNGAVAIVDYAHTPDALEKALLASRELLRAQGRVACVFGCGGDRDRTKRPLMGHIAWNLADAVIVTNDNPRRESPESIVADILGGMPDGHHVQVMPDRAGAIAAAVAWSRSGDIILVAGKGHETYQIVGEVRLHFDDCEEVQRQAGISQAHDNGMATI